MKNYSNIENNINNINKNKNIFNECTMKINTLKRLGNDYHSVKDATVLGKNDVNKEKDIIISAFHNKNNNNNSNDNLSNNQFKHYSVDNVCIYNNNNINNISNINNIVGNINMNNNSKMSSSSINNNVSVKSINEYVNKERDVIKTRNTVNRDININNYDINKNGVKSKHSQLIHNFDNNYIYSLQTFKFTSKEELITLLNNTSYIKYLTYNIFYSTSNQSELIRHMLIIVREKIDFFKNLNSLTQE